MAFRFCFIKRYVECLPCTSFRASEAPEALLSHVMTLKPDLELSEDRENADQL